jgi:hypothetical protein
MQHERRYRYRFLFVSRFVSFSLIGMGYILMQPSNTADSLTKSVAGPKNFSATISPLFTVPPV